MVFSLVSLFSFCGCAQQDKNNTLTIDELCSKMNSDSTLVILDVRTPQELFGQLGKIDNVINIPVQELEGRVKELENFKEREIAVICRSGNRSNTATQILRKYGFNAKNVLGGMIEYRKQENSAKK